MCAVTLFLDATVVVAVAFAVSVAAAEVVLACATSVKLG